MVELFLELGKVKGEVGGSSGEHEMQVSEEAVGTGV